MSLPLHFQNEKRLRNEASAHYGGKETVDAVPGVDKDDDCTSLTSASTFTISTHDSSRYDARVSLLEHFEQQEHEHGDLDTEDCTSVCSLTSTIATEAFATRSNCSFRPSNSICFDDMEDDVLESLDLSTHDVYALTQRARRGGEEEDLAVAIQAAILAREISAPSRPAPAKIQRPTNERQGSVKSLIQARVDTFTRNTRTVEEFVQARVGTFTRNIETISLRINGDCSEPSDPEQVE